MLNEAYGYTLLALISALIATSFLCVNYCAGAKLSKGRMSRVRSAVAKQCNALDDMPSIVRERTNFLKNSKSQAANSGITRHFLRLEDLLRTSGTSLNVWQFLILVFLFSICSTILISLASDVDFIIAFLFSSVASFFLSLRSLIYRRRREIRRFQEIFPDALDLIVRSVRAGLPVSESIKVISAEVPAPVSVAFGEIASNLSIGISLDEALDTLQKKVPIAEVKFFAISLTIQQETGGNIAEILANLAGIMRKRLQIGKKIRAFSSEARASAYIIGSLPFLVGLAIYALNREYIEILFFDPKGQLLLFGALGSIFVGTMVIAKLIRFDI